MFKGVIFDFNGTLFEDYDLQEDAWKEVIRRRLGREMWPTEFRDHFHGLGNVDILTYINSLDPENHFDISITDEKESVYRRICREQPERVRFVPGAVETFDALKAAGIAIAIATASEIKNVTFYYEFFRLERWFKPEHILYDDRTFPLKPAPDVYLKAMERLELDPADCVICEDSKNGLIAAIASGAGRVIARQAGMSKEAVLQDPKIYACINDFVDFYPKYLEPQEMFAPGSLDRMPENTVMLSGETLRSLRHLPVPPNINVIIRKPSDPRHLYEVLREDYPEDHPLRLLIREEFRNITLRDLKTPEVLRDADHLIIPPLPERCAFEDFQNTVAVLRGPNGCPWDKKQTHQSLRDDFLQEVYELLDGLDRNDMEMIIEESGDVLFHILMQAQIGTDNGEYTMSDVINRVNNKIISRHEHVFGNPEKINPDQVMLRWEQIKQKERKKQNKKGGLLDGISRSMPALSMAHSYQERAAKAGFEWEEEADLWKKLSEELDEFQHCQTGQEKEEELGDILFCIVNLARWYSQDPETALRMANLKFYDRLHYIETMAKDQGSDLFSLPRGEKEKYWNEYKNRQRKNG